MHRHRHTQERCTDGHPSCKRAGNEFGKLSGRNRLPPGRSLWMLCGHTLLLPMLTSHGNAAESGNFSCKKLPFFFLSVRPIVLNTKFRNPWNKKRTRGSSSLVVSSKISWEIVEAKASRTRITCKLRMSIKISNSLWHDCRSASSYVISHTKSDFNRLRQVLHCTIHNNLLTAVNCITALSILVSETVYES